MRALSRVLMTVLLVGPLAVVAAPANAAAQQCFNCTGNDCRENQHSVGMDVPCSYGTICDPGDPESCEYYCAPGNGEVCFGEPDPEAVAMSGQVVLPPALNDATFRDAIGTLAYDEARATYRRTCDEALVWTATTAPAGGPMRRLILR